MVVGLPPLEFTECMSDSPYFRENLHKHEKELDNTSQQIKRIIKEVKDLLNAARQLGTAQRSFASSLQNFTFECIGESQTDDEQVICKSLSEFGKLINSIEDERDRMLDNAYSQVVKPLEEFRKKHIGGVKAEKKKFDKETAKFCQHQERHLNRTTKKPNTLKEADAIVDMAERHFYTASMEYVYEIQKVHERKKFEFVETLLSFLFGWLTFYHQGHEVAKDFRPYMHDLQLKIQKTRSNFDDYSSKLKKRMADVQRQYLDEPIKNTKGRKEGYLFLLEKKAFNNVWNKHYCTYDKETKEFTMLPFNQLTTKSLSQPEVMVVSSCVRRMSDSIEKRFCFDLQVDSKPGVILTFQALSEQDRKSWMDIMDGKEPTYNTPGVKPQNAEERVLDDVGVQFVKRCIEVLENRGLEEQGLYRVVGVTSKVNNLLKMGLDRRKPLVNLEDPQEWETKTITSALKSYLRNLPEPLMTHKFHNSFITAVKNEVWQQRVNDVHTLVHRLPKPNFEVLKLLIKHLTNVAAKSDKNLMSVSNLGVCFGPTLLRPEEETVASIMDLKFYNVVVEILITYYEKIFNTEPEGQAERPAVYSPIHSVRLQGSPANERDPEMPEPQQYDWRRYNNASNAMSSSVGVQPTYYQEPFTCTVRTYYEPPILGPNMSSSLYNVHEPPNGSAPPRYPPRQEHVSPSNGHMVPPPRLNHQRFVPNVTSQSESNLNSLHSYSPTNFRQYSRLEPNSTSSSNESVSSTSRDGNIYLSNHLSPEKSKRLNIGMPCPKGYKSPGNVKWRISPSRALLTSSTTLTKMKTLIVLAITLIISESSALPHTTKPKTNKTCICVPFWQCKEDLTGLNEDGHQIINIRKSNNPSFTFEETQLNSTTDPLINPEEPPPPTEKPLCDSEFHVCCPIRCGRRNYISPDEPYIASSPLGNRILSGVSVDAEFAEFPWMLGLLDGRIYRCGATLIHPQVAVTAAHCVHSPGLYRLRAGEWNWMRDDEPNTHQDRSVTRIIIHQFYDPISLINDISLLEVDTPFTLSVNVGIVCLPPQAYSYFEATCVTSGWGKSSYSPGTYVQTLKKLDVPLVPHRVCLRQLADAQMGVFFSLHQSFMCAGGGSKDTCKGDGGSPLVCPIDGQRDRYELVGIVSWGLTCGLYDTPGVYVNVAMFSHWIDVHVIQMGYDPMVYKF